MSRTKPHCERRWTIPEERNRLTRKQVAELFLRQDGRCPNCGQRLEVKGHREVEVFGGAEVRDEHVTPLWACGSNDLSNRELWCKPCTIPKTAAEATARAKSNRTRDKHIGAMKCKSRPMPGSIASGWKKPFGGPAHRREEP